MVDQARPSVSRTDRGVDRFASDRRALADALFIEHLDLAALRQVAQSAQRAPGTGSGMTGRGKAPVEGGDGVLSARRHEAAAVCKVCPIVEPVDAIMRTEAHRAGTHRGNLGRGLRLGRKALIVMVVVALACIPSNWRMPFHADDVHILINLAALPESTTNTMAAAVSNFPRVDLGSPGSAGHRLAAMAIPVRADLRVPLPGPAIRVSALNKIMGLPPIKSYPLDVTIPTVASFPAVSVRAQHFVPAPISRPGSVVQVGRLRTELVAQEPAAGEDQVAIVSDRLDAGGVTAARPMQRASHANERTDLAREKVPDDEQAASHHEVAAAGAGAQTKRDGGGGLAAYPITAKTKFKEQKPEANVRLRIVVHYNPAATLSALEAAALIRDAGLGNVELRQVPLSVSRSNTRFFHAEDRGAGERIANILSRSGLPTVHSDFTHFSPPPRLGMIEVWVA